MMRNFANTCDEILCSKGPYRIITEHFCGRKPIWKIQYKYFSKGKYSEIREIHLCTQHYNQFKKRERISIISAEKINQ